MVGMLRKSLRGGARSRESGGRVLNFRCGWRWRMVVWLGTGFGRSGMGRQRGRCKESKSGQRIRKLYEFPLWFSRLRTSECP